MISRLANLAKRGYNKTVEGVLKVNMLEAKSQLSRLVKEAIEGKEVVIASNGEPMVRLVPVAKKGHLRNWGKLKKFRVSVDAAFNPELDEQIARSLKG
jgi:prevent-host-death family protein